MTIQYNKDITTSKIEEQIPQQPFNIVDGKTDEAKEQRYRAHWLLWEKYRATKEQEVRFFNKNGVPRNIIDYVKDSVDRMNEFHLKPAHKDAWQNNVFDPITRNKLIAILSKIASARMRAELILKPNSIFVTDDTELRRQVYLDLLDNANDHNSEINKLVWEAFTAMSEGTVIGYESWARGTKEIEYVKEFNPDTGEKVTETIKHDAWDDVFGEIVPIEEFYPETIWVNVADFPRKVHRSFRCREMTYAQFKDTFGKFPNADQVKIAGNYKTAQGFQWGIPSDVNQDNVWVMEFYDDIADKMCLNCNGVELYYGCLPWNHKRQPFWIAIFEPIHHQFLPGKSLPDKLMSMQDVDNGILNAMLDQLYIALNSPIFVDGEIDDLDDNYLDPKRIYTMSAGATVQRGSIGGVDQAAFQMLSLIKRSMELTSVSDQVQGVSTGGRKTKYEVQQLQEGALDLAGLFVQLLESAMAWKYQLRLSNILQYYSMPSRSKTGKKKFKYIELDNRKLPNGKTGKRKIQIVGSKAEVPSQEQMAEMEGPSYNPMEAEVQPIIITRDYLMNKDYELGIKIVPNSSIKASEADKANKDIAFYRETSQDPMFDAEMNRKDFARAFGKDEKIVKPAPAPNPMQEMMAGMPGGQPQKSPAQIPQIDMSQLWYANFY